MNFQKPTVAVLFGGRGVEHGVSCRSGAAVLLGLDPGKYVPLPIGIASDGVFFRFSGEIAAIADGSWEERSHLLTPVFPERKNGVSGFRTEDGFLPVDAVIPALHGDSGEDGTVQGLLETLGFSFVGCRTAAGALTTDKRFAKAVASSLGVPVLPGVPLSPSRSPEQALAAVRERIPSPSPLFLKPAGLGSSVGCLPVRSDADFPAAFSEVIRFGDALAEPFLSPVRELEVAYLHADGRDLFSAPGEIRTHDFYSYEEKYGQSHALVSEDADVSPGVSRAIRRYSEILVNGFGIRDLCRVDFFLSDEGLFFNEINPFPGMTGISLYPRLMAKEGFPFRDLIGVLTENALRRRL